MEWKGKMCLQNGYIKHNLIAALGLGGWHGLSRFLSHPRPTPHPTSVLSSSGENSGLWENSKMSVFSKRPLPSFPCSSIHPTINLLVFPTVPNCVHCKEKWQVIWGQIKGKMRAGGNERWRNENWMQKKKKNLFSLFDAWNSLLVLKWGKQRMDMRTKRAGRRRVYKEVNILKKWGADREAVNRGICARHDTCKK